jgi:hypothetical protein
MSEPVDRILTSERVADPKGEWIPYCVRMKLDLVAMKIGLDAWQAMTLEVRRRLIAAPIDSDRDRAAFTAILERAGASAEPVTGAKLAAVAVWRDGASPSDDAAALLETLRTTDLWPRLDMFGRYLVCAFARKNDRDGLVAALAELGVETG